MGLAFPNGNVHYIIPYRNFGFPRSILNSLFKNALRIFVNILRQKLPNISFSSTFAKLKKLRNQLSDLVPILVYIQSSSNVSFFVFQYSREMARDFFPRKEFNQLFVVVIILFCSLDCDVIIVNN